MGIYGDGPVDIFLISLGPLGLGVVLFLTVIIWWLGVGCSRWRAKRCELTFWRIGQSRRICIGCGCMSNSIGVDTRVNAKGGKDRATVLPSGVVPSPQVHLVKSPLDRWRERLSAMTSRMSKLPRGTSG
jgi:hypothetical protein